MTSTVVRPPQRESRDSLVIRFAGDSGDGMQVTGSQFTLETALAGSDFSTFPDFPAEIRAPTGTTFVGSIKCYVVRRKVIAEASSLALNEGDAIGENMDLGARRVGWMGDVCVVPLGLCRRNPGTEGLAWGLVAGLRASGVEKVGL